MRGYAYRSIGVENFPFEGEETSWSAARGLFETSAELRYRFTERWGGVGFVDTGLVTENRHPQRRDRPPRRRRRSACATTPASACSAPTSRRRSTPRDEDGYVALYIGIGQAF